MKIFNFLKRNDRAAFRKIIKLNLGPSLKLDKAVNLVISADSEEWSIILNSKSIDQDGRVEYLDLVEDSVFLPEDVPGWIIL